MWKKLLGVSLFAVLAFTATADAQEQYVELLRQDIKTDRVAIITAVMDFTPEQAEVFWPIHREYLLERDKLGDQSIALLKQYAEVYDNLDDEKAKMLAKDYWSITDAELALNKKYFKKIEKELSAVTAARWIQIENQIDLVLDMQVASNLPLLEEGVAEMQTMEAKQ